MDLKKGLSFVAFGFLFTLVNFNLTFPSGTVNIMPDFVGWILLTMAFAMLGTYTEDKAILKVLSIIMIVVSGALWALDFISTNFDDYWIKLTGNILSAVYMFILLGCLEKVSSDYGSDKGITLRTLKILTVVINVVLILIALLSRFASLEIIVPAVAVVGVVALVTAVVLAAALFGLRKDINAKL